MRGNGEGWTQRRYGEGGCAAMGRTGEEVPPQGGGDPRMDVLLGGGGEHGPCMRVRGGLQGSEKGGAGSAWGAAGHPMVVSPPLMVLCPLTCGRVPTRGCVPHRGVVSVFPPGRVFHASPPTPGLSWGGLWRPHGAGAAPLRVLGIFVWFWGVSMLGSSHKTVGLWLEGTMRIISSRPH